MCWKSLRPVFFLIGAIQFLTAAAHAQVAAPRIFSFHQADTWILLHWDPIEGATGYRLEAKTGAEGAWTEIANVASAINRYTHENLTHSTQYFYRIRAYNAAGISDYSGEWQATTYPPPPPSPELQATARSYNEIELHWKDVLTNCCTAPVYLGYRLEALRGAEWQELKFAGVDDTNHFVRGLQPSTEYSFRIMALNPLESVWSTGTVRTLDPPPIPPQVAPIFYAEPESPRGVRLKWLDVELETEYRIERKNSAGQWEQIAIAPANALFYIDAEVQPSTFYAYRSRAANSFGASPYSTEAGAITRPPPEVPVLRGLADSQTVIRLFWSAAEGATLYRLDQKNAAGEWEQIHETTAEPFFHEDTGLPPFTEFTYRLGARNAAGAWFYSTGITARTDPPELIQAPFVTARAVSSSAIELSWQPIPYAQSYYVAKLGDGWTHTALPATATNYIDSGLAPSSAYTYSVYAVNDVSRSPFSPEITVTTLAPNSGAISFQSISISAENVTMGLTGSAGQKFRIQSSSDLGNWTDITDTLTLIAEMQVSLARPAQTEKAFFRAVKEE
jgi:hypothetical protein